MSGWIGSDWRFLPCLCLIELCLLCEVTAAPEQIPIEQCDRLPVITVFVQDRALRFLVDTAAVSMLNIKSFSGGNLTAIQVTSWKGTTLTSAREVTLPEFVLGSYRLENLSLPAIDLSPIAQACGGQIDGILGVDLLEDMGATLDLKNRVAVMGEDRGGRKEESLHGLEAGQASCLEALNRGDTAVVTGCLDAQVALFTAGEEIRGQEAVIRYLRKRYLDLHPPAHFDLRMHDARFLGDAVWFGYDLTITRPDGLVEAKGMAICRRVKGRWRLLNMHNSFEEEK